VCFGICHTFGILQAFGDARSLVKQVRRIGDGVI
jgi:hypothetical protein